MIKAIVFDFDGVIHDTFEFHFDKVNQHLTEKLSKLEFQNLHDVNIHSHQDNNNNNNNDNSRSFDEFDVVKYNQNIFKEQSSLIMTEEVFSNLQEFKNDFLCFIVTSGSEKNISEYLKNNNADNVFTEVLGMETSKQESSLRSLKSKS